jgi:hypothetical protein
VTIVSGLPRSGTSLMMRMLEAGGIPALTDGVRAADADNPKGYYEFEAVKRTKVDASWVAGARGRAVKMVYLLLADLPAAERGSTGGQAASGTAYRVVFMRRDLREVVASQAAMLERAGKKGGGLGAEQLVAVYAAQVEKCLAWLRGAAGFAVLEVDYNRLMREAGAVVGEVDAFLGGGLDRAAMVGVVDQGLYRQRR